MKKIFLMFSLVLTLLCSVLLISKNEVGAYTPQVPVETENYYRFISFPTNSCFTQVIDSTPNNTVKFFDLVCVNDDVDKIVLVPLILYSIGDVSDEYKYNFYFSIYSYRALLHDTSWNCFIQYSRTGLNTYGGYYDAYKSDLGWEILMSYDIISDYFSFTIFNQYDFLYEVSDDLTELTSNGPNTYCDASFSEFVSLPLELSQQFSNYMNNNIWVNNSYNEGYAFGYDRGKYDGEIVGRNNGLIEGQLLGYDLGFDDGRAIGLGEGRAEGDMWFGVGLLSLVDIPFNIFRQIFNFTIFGFNIYNLIFALLTLGVIIWLLKKLIFNRS